MKDSEIVELYMRRDQAAIPETEKKYGNYLFKISYNILENREDVSECVNDTYLKTWNSIPPKKPDRLAPFLGKIIRNISLNRFKLYTAQKRGGKSADIILSELDECISSMENTESKAEEKIIVSVIEKFLYSQPEFKRNIFVLRYWYIYSLKDISKIYKISENRVATILFRMRKDLKNNLEKEGVYL